MDASDWRGGVQLASETLDVVVEAAQGLAVQVQASEVNVAANEALLASGGAVRVGSTAWQQNVQVKTTGGAFYANTLQLDKASLASSDAYRGLLARSDDDLDVIATTTAMMHGQNVTMRAIGHAELRGATMALGAKWSRDVAVTLHGGNMVAEALVLDGSSMHVADDWIAEPHGLVGSNTTRDTYIGTPLRFRAEEDITLRTDADREVMVVGMGGVQISTGGGTEIHAARIGMASAWNEDVRIATAGGALRTGHLQVSGARLATQDVEMRALSLRSLENDLRVSAGSERAVLLQGDTVALRGDGLDAKMEV